MTTATLIHGHDVKIPRHAFSSVHYGTPRARAHQAKVVVQQPPAARELRRQGAPQEGLGVEERRRAQAAQKAAAAPAPAGLHRLPPQAELLPALPLPLPLPLANIARWRVSSTWLPRSATVYLHLGRTAVLRPALHPRPPPPPRSATPVPAPGWAARRWERTWKWTAWMQLEQLSSRLDAAKKQAGGWKGG